MKHIKRSEVAAKKYPLTQSISAIYPTIEHPFRIDVRCEGWHVAMIDRGVVKLAADMGIYAVKVNAMVSR